MNKQTVPVANESCGDLYRRRIVPFRVQNVFANDIRSVTACDGEIFLDMLASRIVIEMKKIKKVNITRQKSRRLPKTNL